MSYFKNIHLFTVNHKNTKIQIREQFVLQTPKEIKLQLHTIQSIPGVTECCIISTCNRTEYYLCGTITDKSIAKIKYYITKKQSQYQDYIEQKNAIQVIKHLMRMVCALDSIVVGENEILGQVRNQYKIALENNCTASILNPIFQSAISVGKKARSQTKLGYGTVSIPQAAIDLSSKVLGDISNHSVCIIGAGEMARLTVESCIKKGCSSIFLVNRSLASAKIIVNDFSNVKVQNLSQLENILLSVNLVIGCTNASHYIISYDMITKIKNGRNNIPLSLIDISVPRNFDPNINKISNVFYHDIDDLQKIVSHNVQKRKGEEEKVMHIINKAIINIQNYFQYNQIQPFVSSIKDNLLEISNRQLKKYSNGIKDNKTKEIVEKVSNGIINKIIEKSFMSLKKSVHSPEELEQKITILLEIFFNSKNTIPTKPNKE